MIEFQYDHWGQGWDRGVWATLLVYANSYEEACAAIQTQRTDPYENARNFRNKTIIV